MKTFIVSAGTSKGLDLNQFKSQPQFRKATTNMIMATAAAKEALKGFDQTENFSVVLGSSYGEAEVTKDFLFTLDQTGLARPFLFQNSLHNATLGFLTQHFGFQGPAVTVSRRYFTAEATLETAMILLRSNLASVVLAVAVDALVPSLGPVYNEIYPPEVELSQGATALLLANEEGLKAQKNLKPLAVINGIEFQDSNSELPHGDYIDSNGIEKLLEQITSSHPDFNLKLPKPDRSSSVIRWDRIAP